MQLRRAPLAFLATTILAALIPAGCGKVNSPKIAPTADFSASPLTGDYPLDVQFTNTSSTAGAALTSVSWDFGDNTTSTAANVSHRYATAGTYTVSLTVATPNGSDTRTKADYIVVTNGLGAPPSAAFSGSPTSGTVPLTVNFTDSSSPGDSVITGWKWHFGDGDSSIVQNPPHVYSATGTYTVSLSVKTGVATDTETKAGYIVVNSPPPVPPTADFSGTPTQGEAPLAVQFTDQSSPGSAPITSWSWTFGDGGVSTATNPNHTYAAAGTFTVTLTVTAAGSDSETKTGYVTVHPTPVPPTAEFSGTPTSGSAPLEVHFTDQSTPGTSPITSRDWTFGDGGSSTEANPIHTYSSAGSFNVSLTVTTADGQSTNTKNGYIQTCAPPVADFTGAPTTVLAGTPVVFTDLSTGSPTSWSWTFGDNGTSTVQNPSHTYSTPGTYTVSLTARNACGPSTNTKTGYITVSDPCPNPVYTIVDAFWDTIKPTGSVYHTSARLRWNADVTTGCTRSVFGKIYYRPVVGDTTWVVLGQSNCYTITGNRTLDLGSFTVSKLPMNCYQFRIVLFECMGTTEKAVLGPTDDPDLATQCFTP